MKQFILPAKRSWNWKVFLVLAGLIFLAAFAIVPYSLYLIKVYGSAEAGAPGWGTVVTNALINGLLISILGGLGLLISNRIGLGMPFIESWVKKESPGGHFRKALAVSMIAGIAMVASIWVLQDLVFGPLMLDLFQEIGYAVPEEAIAPPLYGLLAAISAGITEETIFRLFGLSILAWIGGLLFHDSEGRPKPAAFWIANLVFALAFGAMHLPDAVSRGWPINSLIVIRTLVLNGINGLVLGWLYWTLGLETAMLAHSFGDVVLYTLIPIVALQEGETARDLALAGVLLCVILSLAWAWRTLVTRRGVRDVGMQSSPGE